MARRNGGFIGQDGLDAPDPPTGVTPTAGNAQVSVAFTAPSDVGTSAITGFVVQVSTDDTAYSAGSNTGTSSPIVVSSLTNDTAATAKVWAINAYGTSAPSGASASFTPVLPTPRAIIHVTTTGSSPANQTLEYVDMGTSGDSSDFGDLTQSREGTGGGASTTRGIFSSGSFAYSGSMYNVIDYVTILSTGNATDFGDMSVSRTYGDGLSNNTRAIFGGGATNAGKSTRSNIIDYVTIANTGNATDFGDLSAAKADVAAAASTTRGVFIGGDTGSAINVIEYITIANTGNTTDFGDHAATLRFGSACASNVRLVCHGYRANASSNALDYITIANTGNTTDFGDLTKTCYGTGATSNHILGIFNGGASTDSKSMDKITIASTGNAADFGDLSIVAKAKPTSISSKHGGIAA